MRQAGGINRPCGIRQGSRQLREITQHGEEQVGTNLVFCLKSLGHDTKQTQVLRMQAVPGGHKGKLTFTRKPLV